MERTTSIKEAKQIFGNNFIGPDELVHIADQMGIKVPSEIPRIPYDLEDLKNKKSEYILIFGASQMESGERLTLRTLRNYFGINPDISEPCFYNQDWYLKEKFVEEPLESAWFLIRKNVFQESRAKDPEEISKNCIFPTAVLCAYSFFTYWLLNGEALWQHDFIWCRNKDHNGDRIYVGKYYDTEGINKNGFSIHRHLSLRNCYAVIDFYN